MKALSREHQAVFNFKTSMAQLKANDCIEQNLLQFMENQLVELAKVRKTESRGAEKNIAAWKLIAIAVLIGVATWSIIKCKLTPWRCSSKEKRVYDTVMATAMITFGACE